MQQEFEKIYAYFDANIRPGLQSHHGDAVIEEISDGVVWVKLLGECSNCPSASLTAEYAIKDVLLHEFPELKDVTVDQGVSQELLDQARAILFGSRGAEGGK